MVTLRPINSWVAHTAKACRPAFGWQVAHLAKTGFLLVSRVACDSLPRCSGCSERQPRTKEERYFKLCTTFAKPQDRFKYDCTTFALYYYHTTNDWVL